MGRRKGSKAWNKGIPMKESSKEKLRIANTGKKYSDEYKKHMSDVLKGTRIGKNNNAWKGGISKEKGYTGFMSRRREMRKKENGGSHTIGEWETLKAQYNWTCPCCGKQEPETKLTEDHIVPVSKGGSDNIENIQPLCRSCNCKKKTKTIKFKQPGT